MTIDFVARAFDPIIFRCYKIPFIKKKVSIL